MQTARLWKRGCARWSRKLRGRTIKELTAQVGKLQNMPAQEALPSPAAAEIETARALKAELETSLGEKDRRIASLQKQVDEFRAEQDISKLTAASDAAKQAEGKLAELQSAVNDRDARINTLNAQIEEQAAKLQSQNSGTAERETIAKQYQAQLDELGKQKKKTRRSASGGAQ